MAAARPRGTQHTRSQALTYTIVQAQNPALTIQGPALAAALLATPEASAPTTITGVAAGHPNATVNRCSRAPTARALPAWPRSRPTPPAPTRSPSNPR